MPLKIERDLIRIPRGYRSGEAASFIAQLDDLTALLVRDLRGLTPRELQWQPGPGRNSIGMLMAHLAIVEAWWVGGPASGRSDVDFQKWIGIGGEDDGMPAPAGGRHPRALRGKPVAFYVRLLKRSRPHVRRIVKKWTAREMDETLRRERKALKVEQHFNRRWVLYHVLEHFGGHYGQILLLKQLMRMPRKAARPRRKPRGRA